MCGTRRRRSPTDRQRDEGDREGEPLGLHARRLSVASLRITVAETSVSRLMANIEPSICESQSSECFPNPQVPCANVEGSSRGAPRVSALATRRNHTARRSARSRGAHRLQRQPCAVEPGQFRLHDHLVFDDVDDFARHYYDHHDDAPQQDRATRSEGVVATTGPLQGHRRRHLAQVCDVNEYRPGLRPEHDVPPHDDGL